MTINAVSLMGLESRMRLIGTSAFDRALANIWWPKVATLTPSVSSKEIVQWMLTNARIRRVAASAGDYKFSEIAMLQQEMIPEPATDGLILNRDEVSDADAAGYSKAAKWIKDTTTWAALWFQQEVARIINTNPLCYDGLALFHASHPVHPYDSTLGVYANVFTGAASGSYPGALPLGVSVALDVARANLGKALAYIASIPGATGLPLNLRVAAIVGPPAMTDRLGELTNADIIPIAATGGAGSVDASWMKRRWALGEPVMAPELGAGYGGSDTTAYLICEGATSDELGGIVCVEREPFAVNYYGQGVTDAQLGRMNEFNWLNRGRNQTYPGHPYFIFQVKAT